MSAYMYVMRSAQTGEHAVGATSTLDENFHRLVNSSGSLPKNEGPWECVYVEVHDGMEEATDRARTLNSLEDPEKGVSLLYTSRISRGRGRE